MGTGGLALPCEVSEFVNVESVDACALEVLELGSNESVASIGSVSWLPEVGPSPEVGAVGWLDPDLSAEVLLWLFLDFGFSIR